LSSLRHPGRQLHTEQRKMAAMRWNCDGTVTAWPRRDHRRLDPAAERKMTATLRRLADEGRVVVGNTTPTDLDMAKGGLRTRLALPAPPERPHRSGAQLGHDQLGRRSSARRQRRSIRRTRRISGPDQTRNRQRRHRTRSRRSPCPGGPPKTVVATPHSCPSAKKAPRDRSQRYCIFLTIMPLFGAISLWSQGMLAWARRNLRQQSRRSRRDLARHHTRAVRDGTAKGKRPPRRTAHLRGTRPRFVCVASWAGKGHQSTVSSPSCRPAIITPRLSVGKSPPARAPALLGNAAFEVRDAGRPPRSSSRWRLALSSLATYSSKICDRRADRLDLDGVRRGDVDRPTVRIGLETVSPGWCSSRWGARSASHRRCHAVTSWPPSRSWTP